MLGSEFGEQGRCSNGAVSFLGSEGWLWLSWPICGQLSPGGEYSTVVAIPSKIEHCREKCHRPCCFLSATNLGCVLLSSNLLGWSLNF